MCTQIWKLCTGSLLGLVHIVHTHIENGNAQIGPSPISQSERQRDNIGYINALRTIFAAYATADTPAHVTQFTKSLSELYNTMMPPRQWHCHPHPDYRFNAIPRGPPRHGVCARVRILPTHTIASVFA